MAGRRKRVRSRRPSNPLRGARTVIISHRGGGGSSSGGGATSGSCSYFAAPVAGGPAVLEIAVVDGVAQAPAILPMWGIELFEYALGPASAMDGGHGWDGGGVMAEPYVQTVAVEDFESYPEGFISGYAMTGGTGWNGDTNLMPH